MKTNKVTKLGISLLSVAALGVVAPALTDVPVFGVSIVKADEKQEPIKYLIDYLDADTGEEITHEIGVLNPGETINIYKNIDGYEVVTNRSWMPDFNVDYRTMNRHFGFADGRQYTFLRYKKVNADAKPSDTSKPEVKPETKPSDTPKPEVKPEPNPSETPKPEVKPETKPSETPKPEVKPEPAPKAEENQEPLKYRITYYDNETGKILGQITGIINPGDTINIYKHFDGHEIISRYSWMPNYDITYDIVNEYSYGSTDGYNDLNLYYKKVNADAKPSEEVKPETKPSDTPKPEVKPEPKPSETPKPEVKPEPAPKDEEKQEPLKYRITYYGNEAGEKLGQITGTINPGEIINIYKHFDGYEITSKYSWMPNYDMTYDIANEYFYGSRDGYNDMPLEYKKVNADAKPSDTPKPEVKPETKPSETPKPEVKPEPKPSETPKPEVKPETKPSDTPKPEVKPAPKPSETPKPEVKPEPKPSETPKPEVKPETKPSDTPKPEVKPAPKPSDTPKPEVKPEPKPSDTPKPEVKPETKLSETPKPEVKPETKPSETPKSEVKPAPKPSETPKPEVKPAPKPSDTSKPEVKPAPKPSETPKQEVKPETKPSETPKPEVKPEPKPSDTSKPEVKPELKPQTNSNTAPIAPVKPVGQTSNSKADKPTSKKETPALPNTGEQSSSLSLVGLLLASLGLAGLTYKGRH